MKTLILAAIRCSLMFTAVTASLFCVRPAEAYTVTLEQMGSNVVANGSGAINLTGLTFLMQGSSRTVINAANLAFILTGASVGGRHLRGNHRTDQFRERGHFLRHHWQRRPCRNETVI